MDTFKIIALILSSSLLSAALTGFITWWLRKIDYKRDIFKEIVKKRIAVYEQIENFLGSMFMVVGDIKTGEKYHYFLTDEKTFNTYFLLEFMKVMKFTTWVSSEIRKILSKFNELVLSNSVLITTEKDSGILIENAIKQYDYISKLKTELESQLIDDYKNIYKQSIKRLKRL